MAEILHKELSYAVVGAAMEVHQHLGASFLEKVYQKALAYELSLRKIPFEQYKPLPVTYKGLLVGEYEADFMVDGKIILEIKAVSSFHPAHEAQALHYLAATGYRLALLLNFGKESLQQKRVTR